MDSPKPDRRMLELLLLLLDARQPLSRAEIFEAIPSYGTASPAAAARKFERDKKDLRELGVPLEDKRGEVEAYFVDRTAYELPAIDLDEEERAVLALAAEALRSSDGLVYRDVVEDALHKICFERAGAGAGADLPPHLAVAMPSRHRTPTFRKLLSRLTAAAENQKRVRITYAPQGEEPTQRDVDPHALIYRAGDWLLVGHCHLRKAERTFRVDRIRAAKVAPRPATPDFDRPDDLALRRALRRSPWVFQAGASHQIDVVLDIGPDRHWMADEDFGDEARREPLEDGWTRASFRSGNPDYVVIRVLDAAGQMVVVAPPELRQRVGRTAEEVAALYEGGRQVAR